MTIWKFTLVVADTQYLSMPDGAELLTVGVQYDRVVLWARVNPDRFETRRRILIRGTGHEVGDEPYIGTVVMAGGALVWHIFDGGPA